MLWNMRSKIWVALLEFPAGWQADPSDVSAASKDRHGSAVNNFRVLTAEE
jgi:hypothetical protein